jgi:hypothetical protein
MATLRSRLHTYIDTVLQGVEGSPTAKLRDSTTTIERLSLYYGGGKPTLFFIEPFHFLPTGKIARHRCHGVFPNSVCVFVVLDVHNE